MSDVNCKELIDFLDEYRTGALAPERRAAFDAHLAICRHCRDYLRTYEQTIAMSRRSMEDGAASTLPPELARAILDAVKRTPS